MDSQHAFHLGQQGLYMLLMVSAPILLSVLVPMTNGNTVTSDSHLKSLSGSKASVLYIAADTAWPPVSSTRL